MDASDSGRDLIPVKEKRDDTIKPFPTEFDRTVRIERHAISNIAHDELEDKYLRLHDEHILLKKYARKQEDKIKKLATKLTRLVNDKKRLEQDGGIGNKKRDVEMEELIQDLQDKVRDVEKQNCQLREKLLVAKQQALVRAKKPTGYRYVSSRIDSGRSKPGTPSRTGSPATRISYFHPSSRVSPSSALPNYAWGLVEEARNEIKNLEEMINSLRSQLDIYEQENEILKEQLKLKEFEYNEELMNLKSQLTHGQKQHVQENMDLIQLHREVKRKSSKMASLQAQYNDLDEKIKSLKMSNDLLLKEIDKLNKLLREAQNKNLELQEELGKASSIERKMIQFQEQINDLSNENKILKESNQKLIDSALGEERYQQYESRESTFKQQISKLEETLKADLNEKEKLLAQLTEVKEENSKFKIKYKELEDDYNLYKNKFEELENKMKIFNKEADIDISELEEALEFIQRKKLEGITVNKLYDKEEKDLKSQLQQSQIDHAETIAELDKIRNMLVIQYKINKDYEAEIEAINKKSLQMEKEYKTKLEECSYLLEMRETRLKKLERELNDIAFGTKQYKTQSLDSNAKDPERTVELERGQNLFEIHISSLSLTNDGLRALKDSNPSTFVTWTFYEFELQTTPILKGSKPRYNSTSQYIVTADDFFLHYLSWGTAKVELHQAIGLEYNTIATSEMTFKKLLDQPHDRLHDSLELIGCKDGEQNILYGILDYWIRMHIQMDQAITLYKERCKALGYLGNNQNIVKTALKTLDSNKSNWNENKVNELHIKILCCNGLQGKNNNTQPSPYCVYKFFNLPDQDTAIIPSSNNPEFHDHKSFPLVISKDLDSYLRNQNMEIYVFDDTDLEPSSYIGKAQISLLPLTENKPIQGVYDLINVNKKNCGTIDVAIYWQSSYISPETNVNTILRNRASFEKEILNDDITESHLIHVKESIPSPSTSVSKKEASVNGNSPEMTPVKEKPKIMPRKSLKSLSSEESPKSIGKTKDSPISKSSIDKQKEMKTTNGTKTEIKSPKHYKQVSFEVSESTDETDNEDIVVSKLSPKSSSSQVGDSVVIIVSHLQFNEEASVLHDSNVKLLFVEYRFLDYPSEELETPFALPKPSSSQKITFNFRKVFYFDVIHADKREKLKNLLQSETEEESSIMFTVVSEPPEDRQDMDCEDVGYSFFNLKEILIKEEDFIDHEIKIVDANEQNTVIGKLTITIEAFRTFKTILDEN